MKKVAITTGDQDGIGFEVTAKALGTLGPQKSILFFLFRGRQFEKRHYPLIQKKFLIYSVQNIEHALDLGKTLTDRRALIEIVQDSSPAEWVEAAGKACLDGLFDSLVTGPLSKQEIRQAKMKDIGHTDIFMRLCKKSFAFMCFIGNKFNVVLVSGHIPTATVETVVDARRLKLAITAALAARKYLGHRKSSRPIAILGLNPHAGDQGIIGNFEKKTLTPTIRRLNRGHQIVGPLVPDVAFLPSNWNRFSFYIAQYHDQGLIPFKMAHGFDSGVHLTLGLSIKRSSVDHGTAKDIFGKNKANPRSMVEAIRWGMRLANSK